MLRRFPLVFQHDSMECGVACLQMVCAYFGRNYSSDYLSRSCFATAQGVSLLGISRAAEKLGLHTVSGKLTVAALAQAPVPCILHWNQNHFVVLYKVKKGNRFHVADPAKGLVAYTKEEMETHWAVDTSSLEGRKGIAMFLQPTDSVTDKHEDKTNGENRSVRFLYGYIRRYRRCFFQILSGLLVGSILQLALPYLTQAIVDRGIRHRDIGFIWLVLAGQFMLIVSQTAIDFVRRWLLLHVSMRVNISLVSDFLAKLFRLPMSFFDTRHMGDILQRIGDHSRVEQFLTGQTLSTVFSLFSLMVFCIVLCLYSGLIFAVFLLGSIVYGLWMALFLHRRKILDYELFEKQAENSNQTYDLITAMQEIKLQNCERSRRWEWEDVQADLFTLQMRSLKLQQTQQAGCILINQLKNMFITILSATTVIHGDMTLGMMLAVQYIIGQLNSPVEQLLGLLYSLQDVNISLSRINEIRDKEEEDDGNRQTADMTPGHGTLRIQSVDFNYDPNALNKTLDNVNLDIEEGKVTAIVGASGSGKSTLVKLLLGYYLPTAGRIFVGGQPLDTINKKWWRQQCGAVMQDGVIFSDTIARNIAVNDSDINHDRLMEAVGIAGIEREIRAMPLSFNTRIGRNGMGLSQGQKQRILIARAVYKNPRYIFLDEATNSLDACNEHGIVERLDHFYRGRTVVIVAHRLSTVRHADKIVVLDSGHIVEQGSHEELTALHGHYYRLVKNQLELGV